MTHTLDVTLVYFVIGSIATLRFATPPILYNLRIVSPCSLASAGPVMLFTYSLFLVASLAFCPTMMITSTSHGGDVEVGFGEVVSELLVGEFRRSLNK